MREYYKSLISIGKNTKFIIIGALFNNIFSFIITLIITNTFGAKIYGEYTYILNYIVIASSFLLIGTNNGLAYQLPRIKNKKGNYISFSYIVTLFFSSIAIILALIFLKPLSAIIDKHLLLISIPLLMLIPLKNITISALRGLKKSLNLIIVRDVLSSVTFLINILFVIFIIKKMHVEGIIISQIIAHTVIVMYGVIYLFKNKLIKAPFVLSRVEINSFMRYSLFVFFTGIIAILLFRTDIAMIGYFRSAKAVGVYRVVVKLTMYIVFLNSNINIMLGPEISALASKNKHDEIVKVYILITRWVVIFGAFVFAFILISPTNILSIFGPDFVIGIKAIIIMAVGRIISLSFGPVALLNSMMNHPKSNLISNIFVLTFNIILNLILIPKYGITGAAIATATSSVLANILRMGLLYYKEKIHCFHLSSYKPMIALIIALGIALIINSIMHIKNAIIAHGVLYSIFIILFISILIILKLTNEEKDLINKLLRKKTYEKLMKINFICPGTQKSGTTSLFNILKQNPNIFLPLQKEIYYFNNDANYNKGLKWYYSFYKKCNDHQILGDITPDYMLFLNSAKRIYDDLGSDTKLIFFLRNPANRAYSQYQMKLKDTEEKYSFEKALVEEPKRVAKGYRNKMKYSYKERGFYYKQLKPYYDLFPKENIKVVIFEHFINNINNSIIDIEKFLDVAHYTKYDYNIISNKGYIPKKKWLAYIKRHFIKPISPIYNKIVSNKLRAKIRKISDTGKIDVKKIDKITYNKLINEYMADIKKLEKLIQIDLSIWYGNE